MSLKKSGKHTKIPGDPSASSLDNGNWSGRNISDIRMNKEGKPLYKKEKDEEDNKICSNTRRERKSSKGRRSPLRLVNMLI